MARNKAKEFNILKTNKHKFKKDDCVAAINEKDIEAIFLSSVRPFSNSGGYIPTSQEYNHKKVYIVVMKK